MTIRTDHAEGSAELEPFKILIVDDLDDARWVLSNLVKQAGFVALSAATGEQALTRVDQESPDLVLLDVQLPDMDGFEVLSQIKLRGRSLPVIMITAYSRTYDATRAVRAGAYDYVSKPFNNEDILHTIRQALREKGSRRQTRALHIAPVQANSLCDTMGESAAIRRIAKDVALVGPTNFSVLILGETGTGKELVAQAVHAQSVRAGKPLVVVDCGAIPATLIESELFGYDKGAFTGATQAKAGAFEMANGGAIFLDEIGNLPLAMQSSLLRVLQTRHIQRIGSVVERPVDFRLIAATNENLNLESSQSAFRRDLYHRLAEFTIYLPPLRERKEDLQFLTIRFLNEANLELGRQISNLSDDSWRLILRYDWPGNVRELRNQLRRAVLLSDASDSVINPELFGIFDSGEISATPRKRNLLEADTVKHCSLEGGVSACPFSTAPLSMTAAKSLPLKDYVQQAVIELERKVLERALALTEGNKAEAARLLHVDYKTIQCKLKVYGISFRKRDAKSEKLPMPNAGN